MTTIHGVSWWDQALTAPGNHALAVQPGAGVTLVQIEGFVGWTAATNDFANAGTPGPLDRIVGLHAVTHGTAPGAFKDHMFDLDTIIGPASMDLSQQPFWSDAPASTGNWSHFTSVARFLWKGARHYPNAMDWFVMIDEGDKAPGATEVTSGSIRFMWW